MAVRSATLLFLLFAVAGCAQETGGDLPGRIPLTVAAGVPLRLYLTKRISKRLNTPVEAKFLAPLYAFDHEVIPPETQVLGRVSRIEPVSKWRRLRAMVRGDFTPLHTAEIEFTSMVAADGSQTPLHTLESPGLNSLFPRHPPRPPRQSAQSNTGGIFGNAKRQARDQIDAELDRVRTIPEMVRGPDRKELVSDYLMAKLPYHPQYIHSRTRFDAELRDPLDFGWETAPRDSLALLGSQPHAGSIGHARMLTPLNSHSSQPGQKVEAVLTEPLFSADHKLVLPEGTHVDGSVAFAKRAGWFHRGGRLRFSFQNVELSPQTVQLRLPPAGAPSASAGNKPPQEQLAFRTQATLNAAESSSVPLKVDKEGGVQSKESKTRFLAAAIAVLIAGRAADNDTDRLHGGGATNGSSSRRGARVLGGGLGFGLLGSIAARITPEVGTALGYYGMAWSVYSTIVARGAEVQFDRNAVIDIAFNQRASADTAKPGIGTKATAVKP